MHQFALIALLAVLLTAAVAPAQMMMLGAGTGGFGGTVQSFAVPAGGYVNEANGGNQYGVPWGYLND